MFSVPHGDEGVVIASRLWECRPTGCARLSMLGKQWVLLMCRLESGSSKAPQLVLCSALDKVHVDAGAFDCLSVSRYGPVAP